MNLPDNQPPRGRSNTGSILVALLWCLALLSVLVIGILHSTRLDLQVGRLHTDRIQARYLALAGIEKTKALLYQNARERRGSAQSHNGLLFNAPQHFKDIPFGRGTYRIFRGGRPEEGGGIVFGVDDEESRLNVNTAKAEDFARLQGLTPDIAASIVDWRDGDRTVTPGGAEREFYLGMVPPSLPKDAPLGSLREMLMIRGVAGGPFLGEDTQLNGLPGGQEDAWEEGGSAGDSRPATASVVGGAPGWAAALTVQSGVENVSASGQDRVNVQSADESTLMTVPGITPDIAKAIVAHRQGNRLESIADLLNVGPAPPPGQGQGQGQNPGGAPNSGQVRDGLRGGGQGSGGANPGGPKVIDSTLLIDIADAVTTEEGEGQPGVMNVNTAGLEALMCLPGVTRELALAIIAYRSSAGFLPNTAALLRVPGMTTELFRQLAGRVTVRSETFRILSEGRVTSSGARQRLLVTVRVGLEEVETLAYREDDL
jgi:DNA uptake protein ComE-like DNA-binding protein